MLRPGGIAGFVNVEIVVFETGSEWTSTAQIWTEGTPDSSLASVIADLRQIPDGEAQHIADETLEQWRVRGGPEEGHLGPKGTAIFSGLFVLVALGAVALAAVAVWLVLQIV